MDTYTIVGGGVGGLPTTPTPWIPPHTTHLQGDLPTPLTHNNTQQHTTLLHNSTQVHKTTNVPVVFMALVLNGFEGCNIITRGITRLFWADMALASLVPFQGPKKSRFSGPTPSNAPCNDVAPLKTITYRAIKTTGTLIVILKDLDIYRFEWNFWSGGNVQYVASIRWYFLVRKRRRRTSKATAIFETFRTGTIAVTAWPKSPKHGWK